MPVEQMYLVELIVKKISLKPGIYITDLSGISVSFKFAQFINFDIDTLHFTPPVVEKDSDNRIINMNYGKTFLFIATPSRLRQLLQSDPYVISLYDGISEIASATLQWKREFGEMIKFFESLGIVKSTTAEDEYEMVDQNGDTAAKMEVFLRMSCFGQNVQTLFQIKKTPGEKQEYIFRQRNASRTFKVEKHEDERCQPLVEPLYGGIADVRDPDSQINLKENVSLTQLFERTTMAQKVSNYQPPDADEGLRYDDDKISICYRPSENKFFDLLHFLSADVKTHDKGTEITIQRKKVRTADPFVKSGNKPEYYDQYEENDVEFEEKDDVTAMTADKIAKKLCGNKDCPAVKKFKEYGIGPLATGKGLGTVYGYVEPPVTYGMSHTYGTMCEYGPYGVFSRPKHEELPFVPRTSESSADKFKPITLKPCKMKRKKTPSCGGDQLKKKKKEPEWHSQCCPLYAERLRGGSDMMAGFFEEQGEIAEAVDEDMVMPKSPMVECRSVMYQFDSILAEYKKALGPCGHATCPYAQTMAEETCKKMCERPLPSPKEGSTMSCNDDPCDVEGCPYATANKTKRYPAGCGSPKCAYTKYKLGLVDEDAELELKFLPPALQDNCGDPHCKYPPAAPLPPIHWDCPDPLPKGPCKNLNCPFQPKLLKQFKTKKQLKTGPCGSPMCPYALPQPCCMPTCPFAMRPCPMAEVQKKKSSEEENMCENPDCPFAESNAQKSVENDIGDSKFKGEFQDCGNPECPYKKKDSKKKSKKKKHKKKESNCGNPDCPYTESEKPSKKNKKHKPEEEEEASLCSNPECPTRVEMGKNKKNRCQESSSDSVSLCSDPECPYAELKKQQMLKRKKKKKADDMDSGDSCDIKEGDSVCSNPECPAAKGREVDDPNLCNVPGCPYSNKPPTICGDPACPYLKPLPSCGIPNCPYEPVPLRFSCVNPKCPSKAVNFNRKPDKTKPGNGNERDQSKTVAKDADNEPCEDGNPCENQQECNNPDCEMKEGGGGGTEPVTQTLIVQQEITMTQSKKKRKIKNRGKFVYSVGDTYPSTKIGHKECVTPIFNVPHNMGWLWNIFTPILSMKPRRGWRPGALTRTIATRLRAHRRSKGLGILKVPTFKKDGTQFDEDGPKVVPKPTLQIQKKEGTYWITMNPLKDPFSLVENEDPYMECTPMTFKITKNKKQDDDDYCYCDGDVPPDQSSSSDSELDIEFTPPAGIIHPERFKKKPNVACCDSQYDPKDFEVLKKKDDKKGKGKGKDKGGKGGKGGKKGKKK